MRTVVTFGFWLWLLTPIVCLWASAARFDAAAADETLPELLLPKSDKDQIKEILRRQEIAFENKDLALYAVDLIRITPEMKSVIERFFNRYDRITLSFENPEITLQDTTAVVIMLQTTGFLPKREGRLQTVQTQVRWKLVKVDGQWKIYDTTLLKKF
ncbi:MAG: hypothetical protein HY283_02600 [Nitrospirae bacterium]|nr:hypothetical protein [Nitrospirota bacterium]